MAHFIAKRFMSSVGSGVDRIAVVTGGGSGIGRSVCELLAQNNVSVVSADLNQGGCEETIKKLTTSGSLKHLPVAVDVSKSESVQKLFSETLAFYGKPASILVNCAGIVRDCQILDMTEKGFDEVIGVNLKGTFLATQAACKAMVAHKVPEGSIVNVSSISGTVGNFGQANYSASKAGVIGFTKTVAKEMAKHGIRCNVVIPGFIDTPIVSGVPDNVIEMMKFMIPMKRVGKPEEVAEAILFLAMSKSSYVTGSTLQVSGGLFP
jgi:17beta-estradiol 17-dehydrogenase/3alpha(17beta)-hydroxysteroid dehydrogenase (NAD+)